MISSHLGEGIPLSSRLWGEASLPGFGVAPISLFPKLVGDYALAQETF